MDPQDVARLQFAVTSSIHYMFVALTLGLVAIVVIVQTRWTITRQPLLERMTKFWGQLYVINYALGIVTGLVMEFQLGLNWAGLTSFSEVFGVGLAVETLTAFFLESVFLGLWIFGWGRLNRWVHLALIWLVAITAYLSAFWVLVANSFMQHPVGHTTVDGRMVVGDLTELLANPTLWTTLPHVVTASLTTGVFVVAGVSAYHLWRGTAATDFFIRSLRLAGWLAPVVAPLTVTFGLNQFPLILEEQPTKLVATQPELAAEQERRFVEQFGPDDYLPSATPLAVAEHLMFFIGLLLALLSIVTAFALIRRAIVRSRLLRPLLVVLVAAIPLPFVANASGWIFREYGRQPWAIYGVLRVDDAVSPGVSTGAMLTSLVLFTVLLATLAVINCALLIRHARRGPEGWLIGDPIDAYGEHRPLSERALALSGKDNAP